MKKAAVLVLALGSLNPCLSSAVGAIAVDDQRGDRNPAFGFAIGERNRQAAEHKALQYCREHGKHCKVAVWFEHCGAYASSKTHYGYGYGPNKAKATSEALGKCGRNECRIVVAKCE
jgi:hypothetical protein